MPTKHERVEIAKKLRKGVTDTVYMDDHSFLRWLSSTVGDSDDGELITKLADLIEPEQITGETSDGYHTFNELYDHRAKLFSVIVSVFKDNAWKSKKHNDGTMYDGMFIVGIDTPAGQATYHYYIDPYWDMFKCKELERAPEWDGYTPSQAIERIMSLV